MNEGRLELKQLKDFFTNCVNLCINQPYRNLFIHKMHRERKNGKVIEDCLNNNIVNFSQEKDQLIELPEKIYFTN